MNAINSMFESIKASLQETETKGGGNFKDFLRPKPGNTYVVRLIPNVEDAKKTFFHYFFHGWQSRATGQYVEVMSPKTWGDEASPIDVERIKLYRNKTDARAIELAKNLATKEKWLVNVYVVDDPVDPENNGTVKVFRFGKQVYKIINDAMVGDDADEFGPSIFDLSENGCNLRIKVESTKEGSRSFITYASSKFLRASAIPNMTEERIKEVQSEVHDLESYFSRKAPAEMKQMLAEHLYGKIEEGNSEENTDEESTSDETSESVLETSVSNDEPAASDDASDDDKIKQLLAGL